jgi:RNase adapter protein RapZ
VTVRRLQRVVLVTGLSGAGKISILRALEDLGYEAVDNPPLDLLPSLVERGGKPLAVGVDARSRGFDAATVLAVLAALRGNRALRAELVYAWASEETLLRRYTESRRRHPLAPEGRVIDGIRDEIEITEALRDAADVIVDTSNLALRDLRRRIGERFGAATNEASMASLTVSLVSFAFRAGLPREADMVFDARFLRNPHYDPILRPRTGVDPEVAAYIEQDPDFGVFMTRVEALLDLVLPRFVTEGKRYVTVAVGCTGGQHRSVHIVELLAAHLRSPPGNGVDNPWQVTVTHRELMAGADAPPGPAAPSRALPGWRAPGQEA